MRQSYSYTSDIASSNFSVALLQPYVASLDSEHFNQSESERNFQSDNFRPETGNQILAGVIMSLICLCSLLENTSILTLCLSKEMRTTTNSFTFVLAAADLMMTLLSMPMTTYTLFAGTWQFSDTLCKIWGFINILTISGSVLSLCNIGVSRYIMVCRPHRFRQIYTPVNTALVITVSVGSSVVISILSLLGWSSIQYNRRQYICISNWSKSIAYSKVLMACFGAPLVIMLVSNSLILRQIRRNNARVDRRRTLRFRTVVKCISGLTVSFHKSSEEAGTSTSNSKPEEAIVYTEASDDARLTLKINVQPQEKEKDIREDGDEFTDDADADDKDIEKEKWDKPAKCSTKQLAKCHSKNNIEESRAPSATSTRKASLVENPVRKSSELSPNLNELRLKRMLFISPIVYATCWTPFCVSMLTSAYSPKALPVFHSLTLLIGYLNCCVNPVIYGLFNTNFHRKLKQFCCKT